MSFDCKFVGNAHDNRGGMFRYGGESTTDETPLHLHFILPVTLISLYVQPN